MTINNLFSRNWQWNKFTDDTLAAVEARLFSHVRSRITSQFIPITMGRIYTVVAESSRSSSARIPVVLIHGFAGGVGFWAANIDAMAENRLLYCFDLLGFGRSSRPSFAEDPALIELQFVQSIENWRKEIGISKMILIGHSFGAFIAAAYTLVNPERVRHLVLVDPWGFTAKSDRNFSQNFPAWMKIVVRTVSLFYPLSALRLAGPYGVTLIKALRPDLAFRFPCIDSNDIYEYIYMCNAQNPSGEIAFTNMSFSFGWAKRPMLERQVILLNFIVTCRYCVESLLFFFLYDSTFIIIKACMIQKSKKYGIFSRIIDLPPSMSITFIFGSRSWIDSSIGVEVQSKRQNSYVDVQVINGAGHHIYADQTEVFNSALCDLFTKIDADEDIVTLSREQ
ncbi:unnamed protein product [Thelazia callipaeda]|uniref:AB hydrolase-1 domain-containing protein n=1 Tax=Thelazia callipaeda TaxID=103827 RepID=A0A0N5CW96_THECL|nr:unnamed protein product [Thelazia callipaeda]